MPGKQYEIIMMDSDAGSGKTHIALERARAYLEQGLGVVYACRTKELCQELGKRAKINHSIIVGTGSTRALEVASRKPGLIFTTHDALIHLRFFRGRSKWVLIHDEKPSDQNVVSVTQFNLPEELYDVLSVVPVEDNPFRHPGLWGVVRKNYRRISFDLARCKELMDGSEDVNVKFMMADILSNSVEYFIAKDDTLVYGCNVIRLINHTPYNNWHKVYFLMANSFLDRHHELPIMRKLRMFNVNIHYERECRFQYNFPNLKMFTIDHMRKWSKNLYTRETKDGFLLENIIQQVLEHIPENERVLLLTNKGYEEDVSKLFVNREVVFLDHAPYGKEKEDYLSCNYCVDVSAKNMNFDIIERLRHFGFSESVYDWNKADDMVQNLLRSNYRRNNETEGKYLVGDPIIAELVSSMIGILADPIIKLEDNSPKIEGVENVDHSSDNDHMGDFPFRRYHITIFDSVRAASPSEYLEGTDFKELCERIPPRNAKSGKIFIFGKANSKKLVDVEYLDALVIDYDRCNRVRGLSMDSLAKKIISVIGKVEMIAQPTFTNGNYRFLIPLSQSVDAATYRKIQSFIINHITGVDKSCSKPSQQYYVRATKFNHYPGETFDPKQFVVPARGKYRVVKQVNTEKQTEAIVSVIGTIDYNEARGNSNDYCVSRVAKLKRLIGKRDTVNNHLWQALFNKIEPILRHEGSLRLQDFIRMASA